MIRAGQIEKADLPIEQGVPCMDYGVVESSETRDTTTLVYESRKEDLW